MLILNAFTSLFISLSTFGLYLAGTQQYFLNFALRTAQPNCRSWERQGSIGIKTMKKNCLPQQQYLLCYSVESFC